MESPTSLHALYAALHWPHYSLRRVSLFNLCECWGNLLHGDCEYNGRTELERSVNFQVYVW
jgi:hypothetical protein